MTRGFGYTYSAQQDSIRDAKTGETFCGIVSLLFWKATAPTTWIMSTKFNVQQVLCSYW